MMSSEDDVMKRLNTRSDDICKEPLTHPIPIYIPEQNGMISLEKAIGPLIDFLPNLETFVRLAKDKCINPADGLTQDESVAIMLYTMDWQPMEECLHYVLNSRLRCENRQLLQPCFLYITLLMRALSHLPSISVTAYRQVDVDLIEKYPSDKPFVWWTFSLCLFSRDRFQSDGNSDENKIRTLFTIDCHSGKDIRKHSYFPSEDQLILMAGSEFRVISSVKNANGQHTIHLEEVRSRNPLLQIINDSNRSEILSASRLLNILHRNIQSKSRVETMEKYIDRLFKLQMRIGKYPLHSSIDLTKENLDDEDISLVIQHAIVKKQCSILRLEDNFITSEGGTILADSLRTNKTLIGLNLRSNRLFDKGLRPFEILLSNNYSVLQKLHLGSNRISNEGALLLAQMLQTNTTLTVLWLDSNRISDEGVHFLSNALTRRNKTLQELSLRKNKFITSLSVPYFLDIFHDNQSLIQLDLTQCSLTEGDNQRLKNSSKEKEYFTLLVDTKPDDCVIS